MKKSFVLAIFLVALIFIISCTQEKVICNKPYIKIGTDCCLDKDDNKICDKDESQQIQTTESKTPPAEETKTASCKDECNFTVPGQCDGNAFYICNDVNGEGCKEKELVDYCGLDYKCTGQFRCTSPTEKSIFEIRSIETLERVSRKIIDQGTFYETEIEGKVVGCEVLKIFKNYATVSCNEIEYGLEGNGDIDLRIISAEYTTSNNNLEIFITNAGQASLSIDAFDTKFTLRYLNGSTVCSTNIGNLGNNFPPLIKGGSTVDLSLSLASEECETLSEQPTVLYTFTLELSGRATVSSSFQIT